MYAKTFSEIEWGLLYRPDESGGFSVPLKLPLFYKQTDIAKYQAAHNISKPLNGLSEAERDAVLVQICKQIADAVNA